MNAPVTLDFMKPPVSATLVQLVVPFARALHFQTASSAMRVTLVMLDLVNC